MLCYIAITYFAVSAWFRLRRMEKQMDEEMKKFKQHFGEDICDVNVMNIHVNSGKEDGE